MSTITERLDDIVRERFNKNVTSFATALGFPYTTVSNYLNPKRKSKPNSDFLEAVVRIVKVNAYWLLTGEGNMFESEYTNDGRDSIAKQEVEGVENNFSGSGDITVLNMGDVAKSQPGSYADAAKVESPKDYADFSIPQLLATIAAKESHIERLLSSIEKKDEQLEKLINKL